MQPYMSVNVMEVAGINPAMYGLSLNKKQPIEKMPKVADKLAGLGNGHNKFLRQIVMWLGVRAPRYWWQEFATYTTVIACQSESTMHTLERELQQQVVGSNEGAYNKLVNWATTNLETVPSPATLYEILTAFESNDFIKLKALLPEGFLQTRVVCMNVLTLQHMYRQRKNHRLPHWQMFFEQIKQQSQIQEFSPEARVFQLWPWVIAV